MLKLPMLFKDFLKEGINLLFPGLCLCCGNKLVSGENVICNQCFSRIEYVSARRCLVCAKPLEKPGICGECRKNRPYFDKLLSIFVYKEPISSVLHYFKYKGFRKIINFLKPFIGKEIEALKTEKIDEIIPVPMHKEKLKEREYNHSNLIASVISETLGIGMYNRLSVKKPYKAQANISAKDKRKLNVKDVFTVNGKPSENILIIDDIVTTGSTVNEISKALKDKGAQKIIVFSLARTPN